MTWMGKFSQSIRRNLIKQFRDQKFRALWMWLPITPIYSFHNIAILSQKSKRSTSAQYLILSEKRLKTTWKHLHLRGFGQILLLDRHRKCISESTKHHFPRCCFLRADQAYGHIPKKEWGQNSILRLWRFEWVRGGTNITPTKNYFNSLIADMTTQKWGCEEISSTKKKCLNSTHSLRTLKGKGKVILSYHFRTGRVCS